MKRGNALLLACLMAVGLSTTAFAEEPQTVVNTENGGASISITDITPREEQEDETKSSFQTGYYPIAIETAEDAGVRLLVKTFLVPEGTDPQALIEESLTRRGITYTRYSDDLAFSGETFSVGELLRFVRGLLDAHGFRLNEGKTAVAGPGQRKRLPGVVVSHKLQADVGLRRQLRQEFYYIGRFGLASHLERTGEQRPPSAYLRRLLGRTGFVLQVNPEDREFQEYLERGKRWLKEQEERVAEG